MVDNIKLINNEGYGAPELKRLYQDFTLKGLIIAVTLHLLFIGIYMLIGYINEAKSKDLEKKNDRKIIVVDPRFLDPPPPVTDNVTPPVKEIIDKVKDLSQLTPEPVRKENADDVVLKTQDELNNLTDIPVSRDGDSLIADYNPDNIKIDDIKIDDKIGKDVQDIKTKETYKDFEVEKPPVCLNLSQVNSSMNYPELALETQQQGRVSVKVLVGTDGSVLKVGSLSGPGIFFSEVEGKVVNLQFTPGLQNNSPVKVWVTVPFVFKLK